MSFIGSFIHPRTIVQKLAVFGGVAALFAVGHYGYLEPVQEFLSSEDLTFRFMDYAVSPYWVLKGLFILAVFVWLAGLVVDLATAQIDKIGGLKASNKELMSKAVTLLIYLVSGIIAIDLMGIDLSVFAVLGGAIGIGVGFGLQKITSNFISGVILLMEKSVEVGDLIELTDGTQGFIRHTSARYSLVETFDGKEVMVPNEDFITSRVINWTLTNKKGRVEIWIGVAYGTNLDRAKELILEAAQEHPRCTKEPPAQCFMDGFGDSSINFVLYFWVDDVTEGRREPKSDVLMSIWRKFQTEGIEIPFPQRDLHIKSSDIKAIEAKA